MRIETVTHRGKRYRLCNGTYYHENTRDGIIAILEDVRNRKIRVRLYYGDAKTGLADGGSEDGSLSRSMGPVKVPILLHNANSEVGPQLLDHCIVRIRYANTKWGGDIYLHPHFHETAPAARKEA